MRARLLLSVAAAVAALATLPGIAAAAPPPECFSDAVWARPGVERQYELGCRYASEITVRTPPAHGQLASFRADGYGATWSYRPDVGAPATDAIELDLTGPGGTAVHHLTVHVIPLSVNSAPSCHPVADARRSDGSTPVEFVLAPSCMDAEHDGMTLHGGGPGVHLDDPTTIRGGHGWTTGVSWRYRTKTTDGAESATYWAVDDLGARSAEAAISVAVGPAVDRLPMCWPQYGGFAPYEIRMRPGATRNFGLACEDADGDPFETRIGSPPQRGGFTTFAADPPLAWHDARYRHVDATYVPSISSLQRDPFTVVATGARGGSETPMAMVPVELPDNRVGGCGWSDAQTPEGRAVQVVIACDDVDGDALQAAITAPPQHGNADPPAILPGRFGAQQVVVRYVPAPGFVGTDTVGVRVGDAYSEGLEVTLSIEVGGGPAPPEPLRPPLLPVGPGRPATAQPPAVAPAQQARVALGARRVRLVRRAGVARIYAAASGVRAVAGQPALAVTCALPCRVEARRRRGAVARGGGRADARQRFTTGPGRAGVVTVSRRAARGLRAGGGLRFAVKISSDGSAPRRVDVRLRVRR